MSFYSFIRPIGAFIYDVFFPKKIIGKKRLLQGGNVVVVCNHFSLADPPMVATLFKGKTYFLAKKELFDGNKLFAAFLSEIGAIPVDRGHADIEGIKKSLKVLKSDGRLCVFPEGTRNKSGSTEIMPFRDGAGLLAFKTKAKILPLCFFEKPRFLRENYIYAGEPFDFSEFEGRKADAALNDELTQKIRLKMNETRSLLRDEIEKTHPKFFKKAQKRELKAIDKANRKLLKKCDDGVEKCK